MKKILLFFFSIALLSGCVVNGPKSKQAIPIDNNAIEKKNNSILFMNIK